MKSSRPICTTKFSSSSVCKERPVALQCSILLLSLSHSSSDADHLTQDHVFCRTCVKRLAADRRACLMACSKQMIRMMYVHKVALCFEALNAVQGHEPLVERNVWLSTARSCYDFCRQDGRIKCNKYWCRSRRLADTRVRSLGKTKWTG